MQSVLAFTLASVVFAAPSTNSATPSTGMDSPACKATMTGPLGLNLQNCGADLNGNGILSTAALQCFCVPTNFALMDQMKAACDAQLVVGSGNATQYVVDQCTRAGFGPQASGTSTDMPAVTSTDLPPVTVAPPPTNNGTVPQTSTTTGNSSAINTSAAKSTSVALFVSFAISVLF